MMYGLMDASGTIPSAIYFVFLVFFGNFLLMNLFLVVLAAQLPITKEVRSHQTVRVVNLDWTLTLSLKCQQAAHEEGERIRKLNEGYDKWNQVEETSSYPLSPIPYPPIPYPLSLSESPTLLSDLDHDPHCRKN